MENYFEEIDCNIDNIYEKHYKPNIYEKSEIKYINIDYDNNGHQGLFNKIIYLSGLVRFCLKYVNCVFVVVNVMTKRFQFFAEKRNMC